MIQPTAWLQVGNLRIVTRFGADNTKLGPAVQVYYLAGDVDPNAYSPRESAAVCGSCPLQQVFGGGCYVLRWQGPRHAWRATHAIPSAPDAAAWAEQVRALAPAGTLLRLGAYGDPAASAEAVAASVTLAESWAGPVIGYSHAWRTRRAQVLRSWVRASVESPADAAEAERRGWTTYLVTRSADADVRGQQCAAEAHPGTTCAACLECRTGRGRPSRISIRPHGPRALRIGGAP